MVDPQVREAIQSRQQAGYTNEQIIADFVAAGYTEAQVQEILSTMTTPVPPPTPADVANETTAAEAAPNPATPQPHNNKKIVIIGSVLAALTVLFLIIAAIAMGMPKALTGLFSSAPYENESEIITQIFSQRDQLKAYGFNLEYQLAVEEQTPEAVVFTPELFGADPEDTEDFITTAEYMLDEVPREVDARLYMSGLMDLRDTDDPAIDVDMSANVTAEPFMFAGTGSVRLVDGVGYGRIDDFPENLKPYLEDIPFETWLILGTEDDVPLPSAPMIPVKSVEAVRDTIKLYTEAIPPEFFLAMSALATSTELDRSWSQFGQLAQVAAPLLEQSSEGPDMAELRAEIEALLTEYPPVQIVGEPEKVTWYEETAYRYEFELDADNLKQLVIAGAQKAGAEIGPRELAEFDEMYEEVRPVIAGINQLVTFAYYFRPDGSSAGFSLDAVVALPPELEFDRQFAVRIKSHQTVQNDGLEIVAPSDVHPLTLEEIEEEKRARERARGSYYYGGPMGDARASGVNASIQQSLSHIRALAEISYNEEGYTYANVCTDQSILSSLQSSVRSLEISGRRDTSSALEYVTCNASADAYAITSPLANSPDSLWCIDSTGFSGEAPVDTLASGSDYRCESIQEFYDL